MHGILTCQRDKPLPLNFNAVLLKKNLNKFVLLLHITVYLKHSGWDVVCFGFQLKSQRNTINTEKYKDLKLLLFIGSV